MKLKLKKHGAAKRRSHDEDTDTDTEETSESKVDKAISSKGSWMKQGWKPVERERVQSAARRGSWTPEFWLKDGEEATIRILTDEPMCLYQHRVTIGSQKFAPRTCLGEGNNCPLCESGNKRQFIGAFTVIDRRKEKWTGKDGKVHRRENSVKVWRCGQRILGQLEALHAKRGDLTSYDISITRSGQSKDTTYLPIPESPEPLSREDKKVRDESKLDLVKVLAPKTRAELLAEMGAGKEDSEEVADEMDD